MANIFDYLKWRADIPLSVDSFNEVDNLILAELSYTELDNTVPTDESEKTLAEVAEDFFKVNDREELRNIISFTAESPFLLDDMAAAEESIRRNRTIGFRHICRGNDVLVAI